MGGKEDTIYGLTGVGDLVCNYNFASFKNFQAGVKLAKGNNLAETIASMSMVVEGARTAEAVYEASKKLKLSTPIIDAVYNVIYKQHSVKKAVSELMNRSLKDE